MTVISTTPDLQARTLTVVAEFAATRERVWQLWSDARQLERWWGPPAWPATFVEHDLSVGGRSQYSMTGPDGDQAHGWWRLTEVSEPATLAFEDGFADADGNPDPALPVTQAVVRLEQVGDVTRMTLTSTFATTEQMQQVLDMGLLEGMSLALGQIDELLVAA